MQDQQPRRLTLVRVDEPRATPGPPSSPEVGQIWIVCPDRGAEMQVLVSEVHEQHVQAMLCGPECDWATNTDAVLDPRTTGVPHPLLVHGDVSGPILTRRLRRSIGRIEPHLVQRISLRGRGLDFNGTDLGRGRAIASESDPRWDWKIDKHRQLRRVRARASELGWEIYKLGPREE